MFQLSHSKLDHELGLSYYLTETDGVSGRIRSIPEDFIVEEVLRGGIIIPVSSSNNSSFTIPLCGFGDYIRAVLVKRNCATITALYLLSRFLKVPINAFSFLGLKDARAVTSQLISIYSPSDLNFSFNSKHVKITCYSRSYAPVRIHELYGNRFTITIRFIPLPKKAVLLKIKAILKKIKAIGGLPAYFGYQRFGTVRPISHRIGKALLNGDFKLAVKYIFEGFQSFNLMNRRNFLPVNYESLILRHLKGGCRDYFRLFMKIPRLLRKLFVNAYQSYLFNKMLSYRIKFGLPLNEAVIGDLVGFPVVGSVSKSHVFMVDNSNLGKVNDLIRKGLVSIVLPIVGYGLKLLPRGIASEPVLKVLEEENVSPKSFYYLRNLFSLDFYGAYRPILFSIEDFSVLNICGSKNDKCTLTLRFVLRKGFYASIFLREIIKPVFPNKNGF